MEEVLKVLGALSNETRFEIVAMLRRRGELCECEIVSAQSITQSKASRHLRELVSAGLLMRRRRAVWIYFSIRDDLHPWIDGLLGALEPVMDSLPAREHARICCPPDSPTCL